MWCVYKTELDTEINAPIFKMHENCPTLLNSNIKYTYKEAPKPEVTSITSPAFATIFIYTFIAAFKIVLISFFLKASKILIMLFNEYPYKLNNVTSPRQTAALKSLFLFPVNLQVSMWLKLCVPLRISC